MNARVAIRSATLAIALTAVLTIGSEISDSLKAFFALTGSPWVGKSITVLVAFGVLLAVLPGSKEDYTLRDIWALVAVVAAGGLAMAGFFAIHAL